MTGCQRVPPSRDRASSVAALPASPSRAARTSPVRTVVACGLSGPRQSRGNNVLTVQPHATRPMATAIVPGDPPGWTSVTDGRAGRGPVVGPGAAKGRSCRLRRTDGFGSIDEVRCAPGAMFPIFSPVIIRAYNRTKLPGSLDQFAVLGNDRTTSGPRTDEVGNCSPSRCGLDSGVYVHLSSRTRGTGTPRQCDS
jgi:hypothetical protein